MLNWFHETLVENAADRHRTKPIHFYDHANPMYHPYEIFLPLQLKRVVIKLTEIFMANRNPMTLFSINDSPDKCDGFNAVMSLFIKFSTVVQLLYFSVISILIYK